MLLEFLQEHSVTTSIGFGISGFYVLRLADTVTMNEVFLVAVLSFLAFVYIESSAFGGLKNE